MSIIEFKYQTMFTCTVPAGFLAVRDFSEIVQSDERLTNELILQTIKLSFEKANLALADLVLSHDGGHCDVLIADEEIPIRVIIRVRPSLVVGDLVFKLDELDI
jgi:hypothetical protein